MKTLKDFPDVLGTLTKAKAKLEEFELGWKIKAMREEELEYPLVYKANITADLPNAARVGFQGCVYGLNDSDFQALFFVLKQAIVELQVRQKKLLELLTEGKEVEVSKKKEISYGLRQGTTEWYDAEVYSLGEEVLTDAEHRWVKTQLSKVPVPKGFYRVPNGEIK